MDNDSPPAPPDSPPAPPETGTISPDDLARLLMASGMPSPEPPSGRSAMRKKLLIAALIGGIGVGTSVMSCVGQSFSYRQARALEGIEQQLKTIRMDCAQPVRP